MGIAGKKLVGIIPDFTGFTRLALIDYQIETGRKLVAVNGAQQCVGLATVVRLVIEKMIERGSQQLLNLLRIDDCPIVDRFF